MSMKYNLGDRIWVKMRGGILVEASIPGSVLPALIIGLTLGIDYWVLFPSHPETQKLRKVHQSIFLLNAQVQQNEPLSKFLDLEVLRAWRNLPYVNYQKYYLESRVVSAPLRQKCSRCREY